MSREPAIALQDDVLDRGSALAARTRRTAESHMREAIGEHLEHLEDDFLA